MRFQQVESPVRKQGRASLEQQAASPQMREYATLRPHGLFFGSQSDLTTAELQYRLEISFQLIFVFWNLSSEVTSLATAHRSFLVRLPR